MVDVNDVKLFRRTEHELIQFKRIVSHWQDELGFWTWDQVCEIIARPGSKVFYVEGNDLWAGVALFDLGPYDADLLYLYIARDYRRQGIGSRLLKSARLWFGDNDAGGNRMEAIHLEVRTSNQAAQMLYESLGFTKLGVRKGYYSDGEDAMIYKLKVTDDEQK